MHVNKYPLSSLASGGLETVRSRTESYYAPNCPIVPLGTGCNSSAYGGRRTEYNMHIRVFRRTESYYHRQKLIEIKF
jgi:hypothetical protein